MYVHGPLPLRLTLRSRHFAFGTAYITVASKLMAGTSVTCTQGPQTLTLNAALEAELHNACAILRETFPDLNGDAISVAYVEEGSRLKEPYSRVMVRTPEDFYGDVVGDLNRRLGLIEGMADASIGVKTVTATAPSSELIGYSMFLKHITDGLGHVEYEFLGYDYVWPRPLPPDPKNPAVAKRA
jgi:predicted membrane GTPase involved in stress response